jgi:Spy/CpxP family protein refolding chaperone
MKRAVASVCLAILCSGFCLAQRGGGRRGGGGGGRGVSRVENEDQTISLFKVLLDLQDEQTQKLRSILDAALAAAIPMRKQETESDPLFEAAKNGKSDEEIAKIAATEANAAAQMQALAARTFAKFYRILTPEQQAKADSFVYEEVVGLLERGQPSAASGAGKP